MTEAFEFMGTAFYALLGVLCAVVALVLIAATFIGIRNTLYAHKIKQKATEPWKGGTRHD